MNRTPALLGVVIGLVTLLGGASSPVAAQGSVSASDILRLQDSVSQAEREVSGLRTRDAQLADQLQGELDNLREEAIYLKVKQRREGTVARTEYLDLRDRIDRLSDRARGDAPAAASAAPATPATPACRGPSRPRPSATKYRSARSSTPGCRRLSVPALPRWKIGSKRRRWSP